MSTDTAPVVVAVDGTDRSAGAIRYATEEARARATSLMVVHVMPGYTPTLPLVVLPDELPVLIEAESREILAAVVSTVAAEAPELRVETALLRGSRSQAIVAAADSAALLVLGRESRTGLDRLATGATAEKAAARASCPVVVVPPDWRPSPPRHRLVVGMRSATASDALVARAFEMAAARGDSLLVVHAWRLPEPYPNRIESQTNTEHWRADGERVLASVVAPWSEQRPSVPVSTRVVHGDPVAALVDAAEEADLLLVARRTPGPTHLRRLGATARTLLRCSAAPVMVLAPAGPTMPDLEPEASGQLQR